MTVKFLLGEAVQKLYRLGTEILRVNDQIRDKKELFDKFIYDICINISMQCLELSRIEEDLYW